MARTIVVQQEGTESTFDFKKLQRKQLYGERRRLVLDPEGNTCERADLTDDGAILVRRGMTAQGYFDAESGAMVESKQMVGLDTEGQPVERQPSTLGVAQDLEGPCDPTELLDLQLKSVYLLDPSEVDEALLAKLQSGDVYKFPFVYRSGYNTDTAFLLSNEEGTFLIVGNPTHPEWCALESLPEDDFEDDGDDDDLDFDFF